MSTPHNDQQLTEFITRHMNSKYDLFGKGPDKFNCYTITALIQSEIFGRKLPLVELTSESMVEFTSKLEEAKAIAGWKQVARPMHGCIVEMSHSRIPHHIGTWIDYNGGGVFHCVRDIGVCFDSLWHLKTSGWRRFIYDIPC